MKDALHTKPKFAVTYRGKMFEVVTWEGKPGIMFEAAVRAPGVRLLIETEKDGSKALLMTREIRREADGYDFRLPGGKVFDTLEDLDTHRMLGEDMSVVAEIAAKKEGREEAGISGGEYTLLEIAKAGAMVEWDLYYFLVKNAHIGTQELEETEQGDIETIILPAKEIYEKLSQWEIREGRSANVLWSWLEKNGYIQFKE